MIKEKYDKKKFYPGICSHLDKDISLSIKECIKCGRKRIEKKDGIFFYLYNGVHYFTRKKNIKKTKF